MVNRTRNRAKKAKLGSQPIANCQSAPLRLGSDHRTERWTTNGIQFQRINKAASNETSVKRKAEDELADKSEWTKSAKKRHNRLMHKQASGVMHNPFHSNPHAKDKQQDEIIKLKTLSSISANSFAILDRLKKGDDIKEEADRNLALALEAFKTSRDTYANYARQAYSLIEQATMEIEKMRNYQDFSQASLELALAISSEKPEAVQAILDNVAIKKAETRRMQVNRIRAKCSLKKLDTTIHLDKGALLTQEERKRFLDEKALLEGRVNRNKTELSELVAFEKNRLERLNQMDEVIIHPIFNTGMEDFAVALTVPFMSVRGQDVSLVFDNAVNVPFDLRSNYMKLMIDGWIKWPKSKRVYAFDYEGRPTNVDSDGYSLSRKCGFELDRPEHQNKVFIQRVDYDNLMKNYDLITRKGQSSKNPYKRTPAIRSQDERMANIKRAEKLLEKYERRRKREEPREDDSSGVSLHMSSTSEDEEDAKMRKIAVKKAHQERLEGDNSKIDSTVPMEEVQEEQLKDDDEESQSVESFVPGLDFGDNDVELNEQDADNKAYEVSSEIEVDENPTAVAKTISPFSPEYSNPSEDEMSEDEKERRKIIRPILNRVVLEVELSRLLKEKVGILVQSSGSREETSGIREEYDPEEYDPEEAQQQMLEEALREYQKSYKTGRYERDLWNVPEEKGSDMMFNLKEYWIKNESLTHAEVQEKLKMSLAEAILVENQEEESQQDAT